MPSYGRLWAVGRPRSRPFSGDLEWLGSRGCNIERFNLAQQPGAFVSSPFVKAALEERGNESLPIIVVDGRVAVLPWSAEKTTGDFVEAS